MSLRSVVPIITCLLLILGLSPVLPAQTASTGALTITISDPSGAAIAGATITLTGATGQTRTQATEATGSSTFSLLPVGNYDVTISASGFKTVKIPSVVVNVAETHVLNRALDVGSQTQEVTVNATEEKTQTESAAVGNVVGEDTISEVPLATRNFTQILSLSSGVITSVNDASQVGRGSQNTFVNGTGDMSSNYQIDGSSVNSFQSGGFTDPFGGLYGQPPIPNPDALQEFKVQTSQYDAGYGKSGGANVNIVTKTGTNTVHGSLFEFVRNDIFNANTFFAKVNDRPRGELKQNQFGGTIGGPIKKDKFFAFFSYQGTRQVNGVASQGFQTVSLPEQLTDNRTAAALGAAFCLPNNPFGSAGYNYAKTFLGTSSTGTVIVPTDVVQCNGSNISPVALSLLNAKLANGQYVVPSPQTVLSPGTPSALGFASFSVPATFNDNQGQLNLDYVISPKHTLSEKVFYGYGLQINQFSSTGQPPGGGGANVSGQVMTTTKFTSILSNDLVNEAHFTYLNKRASLVGLYPVRTSAIGMTPSVPYWTEAPIVSITGLFSFGGTASDTGANPEQTYEYGDQLSWDHGKHTIRTGVNVMFSELNANIIGRSRGTLTFQDWADFLIGATAAQNGTTQSNISSISATIQEQGGTRSAIRANYVGSFIQDDFKMNSRLTWNLGLRWEYNGNPYDTNPLNDEVEASWAQLLTVPVPPASGTYVGYTAGTLIGTPLPPGIVQRPSKLYTPGRSPLTNFGPRLGFAWQPLGNNGRFVVRGGFGIFYNAVHAFLNGIAVGGEPGALGVSRSGSTNALSSLAVPYNPAVSLGFVPRFTNSVLTAGFGADPNLKTSTMFAENLNIQYQIKSSLVLEVGYVGNRVEHITIYTNPKNIPQLASPTAPVNCSFPSGCITTNTTAGAGSPQNRVPVLGVVPFGMTDIASIGDSEYNSVQTTLRKTFSHGLQFQAAYTFGRTFTDARGADWISGASFNLNDPTNRALLRGPADFDRPQRLVVSYVYQLPDFYDAHGFKGKSLSGWGVSGVTTVQTGSPLTLTDSRGMGAYGGGSATAELGPLALASKANIYSPGSIEYRALHGYFNPAAFSTIPLVPNNAGDTKATGFGDSPTGYALGPGQFNWDFSITKKTVVGGINEGAYLEFRSEFYNAFNHPQFSNPAVNVGGGATFGTISSTTVGPRIVQFALKYEF